MKTGHQWDAAGISPEPIVHHFFVNAIEKGIDSKVLKFTDDVKVLRTV